MEAVGSPLAQSRLEHVMVVGGTPKEWDALTQAEWLGLASRLGEATGAAGARWLTLRPYGPEPGDAGAGGQRLHWHTDVRDTSDGGVVCTVIVDSTSDGRDGFATAAASIPASVPIDEQGIARALYSPADAEPDLIVIVGPHDRLPASLVWELAYGELVYVDAPSFHELSAADLGAAIDTYHQRHRRFGGI
jgi:undecaprenyl diphosphate synthase